MEKWPNMQRMLFQSLHISVDKSRFDIPKRGFSPRRECWCEPRIRVLEDPEKNLRLKCLWGLTKMDWINPIEWVTEAKIRNHFYFNVKENYELTKLFYHLWAIGSSVGEIHGVNFCSTTQLASNWLRRSTPMRTQSPIRRDQGSELSKDAGTRVSCIKNSYGRNMSLGFCRYAIHMYDHTQSRDTRTCWIVQMQ